MNLSTRPARKIGILGGTFDPIHQGHLRLAQTVLAQLKFDQIWLMPNAMPPHKQRTQASNQHRLAMIQAACQPYPQLHPCDFELKLAAQNKQPSYTAQTLAKLKQTYPEDQFHFLLGMDSFLSLPKWYDWQQLVQQHHFVVLNRPQYAFESREHAPELAQAINAGRIQFATMPAQAISSTEIRQQLQQGNHALAALPSTVSQYIAAHQLYRLAPVEAETER